MRFHKIFLLLPLLFFVCAGLSHAQQQAPFNIRFSPYPLTGTNWSGIYYAGADGQMKPVGFLNNPGLRSPQLSYSGESPLRFYRMQLNEEGVETPVQVAAVDLDDTTDQYLLMFAERKDATTGNEFEIIKMDDSRRKLAAGNLMLFNAYPHTLYVAYGAERVRVQPGQFSPPLPIPDANAGGAQVMIARLEPDGTPISLYSSRWRFDETNRELIILLKRPDSDKLRITQLTQHR